ncbi:hypothetical protein C8T65DRAFT_643822 [Cerioporus squamosus]|nr:hypothetical protein C8T65DRAFT_643822 [Cerioporus squamosus]
MAVLRTPLVPSTLSTYRSRLDEWSIDADCTSSWGPRACTSHVFVQDIRRHLLMGSSASPPSSSSQPAHPRSSLLATSAPVMSDVDATTPAQYTPYLQFRNITVVTCDAGLHEQPVVYRATAAFLIQSYSSRWLLIEFSHLDFAHAGGLPFPTAPLAHGIRVLVLKLPSAFDFEYFPNDCACRWIAVGERTRLFSLVFVYQEDYHRLQMAMAMAMSATLTRSARTSTVSLASRASLTLAEMFKQLGVDRLPRVEEEEELAP